MKKIEAFIRPFKMEEVKNALNEMGIEEMTVTEVKGCDGRQGPVKLLRGAEYIAEFLPVFKLDLIVDDHLAECVVDAIVLAGRTGRKGDGRVSVSTVDRLVCINEKEEGYAMKQPVFGK
jgi:nitrogen regulatory protein P-II 1